MFCSGLARAGFFPPILSPPSITLSYSLCVIPAVFPIKTHLDSRLLSSLELICASIHLLMKSPTHFSHRGIHSSPPVSLCEQPDTSPASLKEGKKYAHIRTHIWIEHLLHKTHSFIYLPQPFLTQVNAG